jgi:hypothetical protein
MFKIHAAGSSLDFAVFATMDEVFEAIKKSLAEDDSGTFFSDVRLLHRASDKSKWSVVEGFAPFWRPTEGVGIFTCAYDAMNQDREVEFVLWYDGDLAEFCYSVHSL